MNKNICSILIVITLFVACKQSANQDKTETAAQLKHSDSVLHTHTNGSKKSCCIGPPSRLKIKVDKK